MRIVVFSFLLFLLFFSKAIAMGPMRYTVHRFGPNAFPIPEMSDARVESKSEFEINADGFWGYGDHTLDFAYRFEYVVVPNKVSVWSTGVVREFYKRTDALMERNCIVGENDSQSSLSDIFVGTRMSLLQEKKYRPDVELEVVVKTASSKESDDNRYFDSPGYIFNVSFGKSIKFNTILLDELRFVSKVGFLCYQMKDLDRQEDAVLYGAKVLFRKNKIKFNCQLAGFKGWRWDESYLVSRVALRYDFNRFFVNSMYQKTLSDYLYDRVNLGVGVKF